MQNDVSVFIFATLLLFSLSTVTLIWFWAHNRATEGLSKLLLSCIFGGVGLAYAFSALEDSTKLKLIVEYGFLIAGHLTAWLGIASFWQRQTRMLAFFATVSAVVVYLFEVLCILNGAGLAERTAIAASYYALSGFGVIFILARAKSINREIYHTAINQSQVGTGVIMVLFVFHAIFNLYHFMTWEGFGMLSVLGIKAPAIPLSFSLIEALAFAPMLVLGTVIMVTERLQTELRIEQMLDPVTKGLNKRAFIAVSKAILARARRNADAVTLIMVEVANFKLMREKMGRHATDAIIAQLGHCIFGDRREQDIFCRFSNDEFMLLLPGTPEEGAEQVVQRITDSINDACKSYGAIIPETGISARTSRGDDLEIDGMVDGVGKQ